MISKLVKDTERLDPNSKYLGGDITNIE